MTEGRVIAIGDIHGCATALAALIQAIDPTAQDVLIPLGDYIDRGPDSRSVIEQLIRLGERCQLVPLLGNHEEMLLSAVAGQLPLNLWFSCGGMATLNSYRYSGDRGAGSADFPDMIFGEHLEFIEGCRDHYETVRHFFAHAYYDPHVPLALQRWDALRWTSLPAVPEPHCSGKTAVVGHTAQVGGEVLDLGFLKCIDTCCHGGAWLTALDVNNGKVWQANEEGELREE